MDRNASTLIRADHRGGRRATQRDEPPGRRHGVRAAREDGRMTTWEAVHKRSLDEIDGADPLYRPTNFWQPGLRQLLTELEQLGLERFKSWPAAT